EKLSDVRLMLQGGGGEFGSGVVRDDRTLVFHAVAPNAYRVVLSRAPGMYLTSVHWGSLDVTESEIDLNNGLPPQTELAVVLGVDCGELTGKVNDAAGQPAESAIVTLVPAGPRHSRNYFKSASTDAT